jgi:hypothetical protein
VKPLCSLPCLQEISTETRPQPAGSRPYLHVGLLLKIRCSINLPPTPVSPKRCFLFEISKFNCYKFHIVPLCSTFPAPHVLLNLTVLLFGKEDKLLSSSFCYFLTPSLTSFSLGANVLPSILYSNILDLCCFIIKFHTHLKSVLLEFSVF